MLVVMYAAKFERLDSQRAQVEKEYYFFFSSSEFKHGNLDWLNSITSDYCKL